VFINWINDYILVPRIKHSASFDQNFDTARAENLECAWNLMAHGDAREGKWRGNWRMEWVASTLHTTSERGVSSITNDDAHTSAASSRLIWHPRRFKMDSSISPKDEIYFLHVCHHISNAVYHTVKRTLRGKTCLIITQQPNVKHIPLLFLFLLILLLLLPLLILTILALRTVASLFQILLLLWL
jgi:hypothetical protein